MLKENKIYLGKVVRIGTTFAIIDAQGMQGICHISEISDYHVHDIGQFLTVGQSYYFQLKKSKPNDNRIIFSFKAIRPKLLKNHRAIIPTVSGFAKLLEATNQALEH